MYVPHYFKNEDIKEVRDFIDKNGFGILVSCGEAAPRPVRQAQGDSAQFIPVATHIPLLLDKDEQGLDILSGHIARMNPHHKLFTSDAKVLAILLGPHAYVSSSWYSHENVPTWNYIAVHIYGTLKIIDDDRLYRQLKLLVEKYEKTSEKPVNLESMSQTYVKKQMGGIVGFEIQIEEIQAAYKLSQNRNVQDHANIIHELEKRGDAQSIAVAGEMKKKRKN